MTMQWIGAGLGAAAVVAAVAAALPVVASDAQPKAATATAGEASWLSVAEVAQRLEGQGFRVLEVEREDRAYEVEAIDAQGARKELYVDPTSGAIIKQERD